MSVSIAIRPRRKSGSYLVDERLEGGATHDFRVRACRTLSCSGFSNTTSTFVFEGGGGGCTSSADSGEPVLQSGGGEPTTEGTADDAVTLDSGTTAAPIPPGC